MQHLLQGDFAGLLVPRGGFTGASRQGPQILHVCLVLLIKMVEGVFRIGIAVQLQVHLRIIRLELRHFLTHEPVHACSIAVALGMGKNCGGLRRDTSQFKIYLKDFSFICAKQRVSGALEGSLKKSTVICRAQADWLGVWLYPANS
jgi:hypothetical protein